jgi:hypothetical protein
MHNWKHFPWVLWIVIPFSFVFIITFIFWLYWGFEVGQCLLSRLSNTWTRPTALFYFFFQTGSWFLPRVGHRLWSSHQHLPCSWDHSHMPHETYLLRWYLANFLSKLALNNQPPDLCLPSSWNYRCDLPCLAVFIIVDKNTTALIIVTK